MAETSFRYSLTTLTVPRRCLGMARRRVGRGGRSVKLSCSWTCCSTSTAFVAKIGKIFDCLSEGTFGVVKFKRFPLSRVLLDRAHTDYDNAFHGLDPEILDLPPSPSPPTTSSTTCSSATNKFASTSETNTSDRSSFPLSSSSSTDLSQILLNIKSCRWRHFRPRTLPLHELDNAHPLFRRLSRSSKRPASAAGGQPRSQRPARVVPAPTRVAGRWLSAFSSFLLQLHSFPQISHFTGLIELRCHMFVFFDKTSCQNL